MLAAQTLQSYSDELHIPPATPDSLRGWRFHLISLASFLTFTYS